MVCFYLYGHIKIYIFNSFYGLFLSIWTYKDIYIYIILSMVCFYLYGHIKIYIYNFSMFCFYIFGHIKIYIYNSDYGLFLSLWIYKDIYIYI